MEKIKKTNIYIDGNNLHRSSKELDFNIDYKKFRKWLGQKYQPSRVYLFIGLIPKMKKYYNYLSDCGYTIIFKKTIFTGKRIKGNCDSELILKNITDYYENNFNYYILISGDGDFGCLIEFFNKKQIQQSIISPDRKKCSFLLRNKNIKIIFLNEQYHKFSRPIIKKAPDADLSA